MKGRGQLSAAFFLGMAHWEDGFTAENAESAGGRRVTENLRGWSRISNQDFVLIRVIRENPRRLFSSSVISVVNSSVSDVRRSPTLAFPERFA